MSNNPDPSSITTKITREQDNKTHVSEDDEKKTSLFDQTWPSINALNMDGTSV